MLKNTCPSDEELAGRIQNRDSAARTANRAAQVRAAEAFERLYARYEEPLGCYLLSYVREDPAAAQDLVQETFLRVWLRVDQWSGQGGFKAWLYRIATNLALNQIRSQRRHPAQSLMGEDEDVWDEWSEGDGLSAASWLVDTSTLGPDAALEQAEERARLNQAIDGLPEKKREVFRLVHEMELSIRDAADRLGIPEGTVKSRLYYAEKQLSEGWDNQT